MRKTIAYFSRGNLMRMQYKFEQQGIEHKAWFKDHPRLTVINNPEESLSEKEFLTEHKSMVTKFCDSILKNRSNDITTDESRSAFSDSSILKSRVDEFLGDLNMFYMNHKSLLTDDLTCKISQQSDNVFKAVADQLNFIKFQIKALITLYSNSDVHFFEIIQNIFDMYDSSEDTYNAVNSFFTAYLSINPSSKITMPAIFDCFEDVLSKQLFLKFLFALDELHNNIDHLSLNEYSELVFYGFLINGVKTNHFDNKKISNMLAIDSDELITIDFSNYGIEANDFRNSIWLTTLINFIHASDIKGNELFFEKIKKGILYFTSGEEAVRLINLTYMKCEKNMDESIFKLLLDKLKDCKRGKARFNLLNRSVSLISTCHDTKHLSSIVHSNLDGITQLLSNEDRWLFFKSLAIREEHQGLNKLYLPNTLCPLRDLFIKQLQQLLEMCKDDALQFNELCLVFTMDLLKQDESKYSFCISTTGFILN